MVCRNIKIRFFAYIDFTGNTTFYLSHKFVEVFFSECSLQALIETDNRYTESLLSTKQNTTTRALVDRTQGICERCNLQIEKV